MVRVVLVEPKHEGNIGAVARVMKNFAVSELVLLNPCRIAKEAYQRAMHARDILENARIVTNFEDAIKDLDYIIGTSGIANIGEKKYLRAAITPEELGKKLALRKANVGLLFGREDFGLSNNELKVCDILVTVPCSNEYKIMNLSHAACIVLYELFKKKVTTRTTKKATGLEKQKLLDKFSELLEKINYPEHRKENTKIMFKRIIGRAMLSKWEFYTFMGILSRACKLKN